MKILFSFFVFAMLLTAAHAAFSQTIKPREIVAVKLTDEGCFGFERQIEIVFNRDGNAAFHGGKNSASRKGDFRGTIGAEQFAKLAKLIAANNFFALANRYEGNVSDIGTKTITVVYTGGEKSVVNWGGSDLKEFTVIKNAIRRIESKIKWQFV